MNEVANKVRYHLGHLAQPFPKVVASEAAVEIERLQGVINQHNLCHDLHGKVSADDFAKGCEAEQQRVYGYSPTAARIEELTTVLTELVEAVRPVRHAGICEHGWGRMCAAWDRANHHIQPKPTLGELQQQLDAAKIKLEESNKQIASLRGTTVLRPEGQ